MIRVPIFLCLLSLSLLISQPSLATPSSISHSDIMDETTLFDDKPKAFDVTREWWFLSGSGESSAGWMLELSINGKEVMGDGYLRLQIEGESLFIVDFPFPTAYVEGVNNITITMGPCQLTIWPEGYRTFEIKPEPSTSVFIETWSRGIPLWYSKGELDMLNLTNRSKLGGFDDAVAINMTLKRKKNVQFFQGFGVYEHSYVIGEARGDWVWFIFNEDNIYGILLDSRDPKTGQAMIHTGRLGFPEDGDFYPFDNYTLITDGSRHPARFQIEGSFNFTIGYYNVYLNSSSTPTYPFPQHKIHFFVNIFGNITDETDTIHVNASALGEVDRPWINIYTDKLSYTTRDTQRLGLDVLVPDQVANLGLNIWLEWSSGQNVSLVNYTFIPTPIDYENPSFRVFILPLMPSGTYVWHAALVNMTSSEVLNEDTAAWKFTNSG